MSSFLYIASQIALFLSCPHVLSFCPKEALLVLFSTKCINCRHICLFESPSNFHKDTHMIHLTKFHPRCILCLLTCTFLLSGCSSWKQQKLKDDTVRTQMDIRDGGYVSIAQKDFEPIKMVFAYQEISADTTGQLAGELAGGGFAGENLTGSAVVYSKLLVEASNLGAHAIVNPQIESEIECTGQGRGIDMHGKCTKKIYGSALAIRYTEQVTTYRCASDLCSSTSTSTSTSASTPTFNSSPKPVFN